MQNFDYTTFRGEVKKQMMIQGFPNYKALSSITENKRSYPTISAFMCGARNSARIAMDLKKALNIKEKYGFEILSKGKGDSG